MNKVSVEDVIAIVENEGLGYSIGEYLDAKAIEDETLSDLWDKAQDALNEVKDYLDIRL